jgi:hypothetical protein
VREREREREELALTLGRLRTAAWRCWGPRVTGVATSGVDAMALGRADDIEGAEASAGRRGG